jgi:hypothetical protein
MSIQIRDSQIKPLGYLQLTSLSGVTSLTAAQVPDGTRAMLVQAEAQDVRYTDDGSTPSATVGMIIPAKSSVWYTGWRMADVKFIETAASAKVNILFYG